MRMLVFSSPALIKLQNFRDNSFKLLEVLYHETPLVRNGLVAGPPPDDMNREKRGMFAKRRVVFFGSIVNEYNRLRVCACRNTLYLVRLETLSDK